jgi:hypothetical protein
MDTIVLLIALAEVVAVNLVLRIGRRLRFAALLRHRLDSLVMEAARTYR